VSTSVRIQDKSRLGLWDRPGLDVFIHHDILDEYFFNQLKTQVKTLLTHGDKKTYLTHGTTFSVDGNKHKLISHAQNAREQNVIYDLTHNTDWYHQTKDTIRHWSDAQIKSSIGPAFIKYLRTIENLEPFCHEKDDWIFYRMHINYLAHERMLTLHYDSGLMLFNDHTSARTRSVTCYLYDHTEGMGGEFWSLDGFVFKPKANSILNINGNQVLHGVTQNMNTDARLAFTVRIAHKDDLYLPGHPDKHLYDVVDL
jgi:hypothetical protein